MTCLAIYNNKGGVGKTTLTVHLAYVADELEIPTLVVAMDRQGDTVQWLTEGTVQDGRVYQVTQHVRVFYSPDACPPVESPLVLVDMPPEAEAPGKVCPDGYLVPVDGRLSINDLATVAATMKTRPGGHGITVVLNRIDAAGKRSVAMAREALGGLRGVEVWPDAIGDNHAIKRAAERFQPAWKDPYGRSSAGVQALRTLCERMLSKLGVLRDVKGRDR